MLDEWKTTTFGGRAPAPLVRRLPRNGSALIPTRRELPGGDAADQRQHDPHGDDRPAITGGEMGEPPQSTCTRRNVVSPGALSFHGDPSRTASRAPDGAAVRVFSKVTQADGGASGIEPARQLLVRCSSSFEEYRARLSV
jgi:hypothetical protein